MPVVQQKQCDSDEKPGKNEVEYQVRSWMIHNGCPNCDTKRSTPCQNCQSK